MVGFFPQEQAAPEEVLLARRVFRVVLCCFLCARPPQGAQRDLVVGEEKSERKKTSALSLSLSEKSRFFSKVCRDKRPRRHSLLALHSSSVEKKKKNSFLPYNFDSLVSGTGSLRLCSSSASHRCVLFLLCLRALKSEKNESSEGAQSGNALYEFATRSAVAASTVDRRPLTPVLQASSPSLALCPEFSLEAVVLLKCASLA